MRPTQPTLLPVALEMPVTIAASAAPQSIKPRSTKCCCKLKVEELQAAYGFSSSPLPEALSRLSQEGWCAPTSGVPALLEAIEHGADAWEAAIAAEWPLGDGRCPVGFQRRVVGLADALTARINLPW